MPSFNQRLGLSRYEADEYYARALEAYRKRDFDRAIEAMNDAIEMVPRKAEYLAARGFFYLEDGNQKAALEDFHSALVINRYEMLAHYGRGVIAYKDQNWDEAFAHFKDAFYIDQNRAETLYYLSLVYYHKRDYVNAINFMVRAGQAYEHSGDKRKNDTERWIKKIQDTAQKGGFGMLPGFK
jgi:tetratricopeptide (TPR) repeat protein